MNSFRKFGLAAAGMLFAAICLIGFSAESVTLTAGKNVLARSGVNVLVGEVDGEEVLPEEMPAPDTGEALADTDSGDEDTESVPETEYHDVVSEPDSFSKPEDFGDREGKGTGSFTDVLPSSADVILPDQPEDVISVPEEPEQSDPQNSGIQTVRLGFAGDINFDEEWVTTEYMDREGGIDAVFSANLMDLMRGFDIFMLNNEFTYSTRGTKSDKTYHFRADPSRVDNLKELGVDIVLLANNHVFDYGEDALLDTLDTLKAAGIPYVGAGRDLAEASRPYYFTVNGRKIAYVAASSAEEYTASIATREATADECGIMACYNQDPFIREIQTAASEADYVIANVHWGMEYEKEYYDEQREFAEDMIKAGADAIIGTHTHCLQGVNFISGKPVFYNLGNYWFNELDLYTGVAELTLQVPADTSKPVSLESTRFYPCTQRDLYTEMPEDAESRNEILRYLEDISDDSLTIDTEGYIHPAG